MWDRGVVATVDVFKGVQRQLLRVRQIRDVQRHSGGNRTGGKTSLETAGDGNSSVRVSRCFNDVYICQMNTMNSSICNPGFCMYMLESANDSY